MIKKFLFGFLVFAVLSGCEDPDELSTGVLPASDQFGIYDTTLILKGGYTVLDDSIIGSNFDSAKLVLPFFLGAIDDPEIGTTSASCYMQVLLGEILSTNGFDKVTIPDSVILSFGYKEIYGDTTAVHQINVYKMVEQMDPYAVYYTNKTFLTGTKIGSESITPNRVDSVYFGSTKAPAHFRIKLDDTFGVEIMERIRKYPHEFTNNTAFLKFLNGIYLEDNVTAPGSILYFNSASPYNAITVYYTVIVPNDTIQKHYSFPINNSSARLTHFTHTYKPWVLDMQNPKSTLYIRGYSALKSKLDLTGLEEFVNGRTIAINKAELIIRVQDNSTLNGLNNYSKLSVWASDSVGNNNYMDDILEPNFGGDLSGNEYRFNIARYLQQTLNGSKKNYGLYLSGYGVVSKDGFTDLSGLQRTLLKAGDGDIKLNITYTVKN